MKLRLRVDKYILIKVMSQQELKQRLSTITTGVGLTNGRRFKTTADPNFNTIHESMQKGRGYDFSGDRKSGVIRATGNKRYSQAWSVHNHHSADLRRAPVSLASPSKAEQGRHGREAGQKIRMKSEYSLINNKIMVPYLKLPQSEHKASQELLTLQQMQKDKNKRIQQIYNPQSMAANPKSISVLRKNKSKTISINKLGAQLLGTSSNQPHENSRGSIGSQKKQKSSNVSINSITIAEASNRPKILPVTFKKIQQLSTIKQGTETYHLDKKQSILPVSLEKDRLICQHCSEKVRKETVTECLSVASQAKTPNSEHTLPFPKFNQFFESHSKDHGQLENKIKMLSTDADESRQRRGFRESKTETNIRRQKLQELTIFKDLQKSSLKVVKGMEGVFYGQLDQGDVKNGKGAIFYYNGKIYQGGFKNGEKEGDGIEQHPDGSIYIGQFKNGKRNGKGRFQWSNGQVYDGQWQNNLKHGSGLWESKGSLASYIGEWSFGSISGFGVLSNQKGQRYEGEFQNFNKQGHGAYRFQNGDRLVGSFKRNQPNGQCEYFWANGDYYKGDFSNGLRHGKGAIRYNDGSFFEGEFRNDKKCGLGRQQYNDGVIYFGNYQNDLRHGYGKLIFEDQVYYEGYWLNNVAVIFQEQSSTPDQILEDDKERLASGMSNKFSSHKLNKLGEEDQQKIIKSMRSKAAVLKKSKIQRFSSKNLLQRLCGPKKRCRCLLKH